MAVPPIGTTTLPSVRSRGEVIHTLDLGDAKRGLLLGLALASLTLTLFAGCDGNEITVEVGPAASPTG